MRIKFFFVLLLSAAGLYASDTAQFSRSEIIYGRKDGMALTMTMLKPAGKLKGKAIISVLNGNWISSPRMLEAFLTRSDQYLESGYTLFGVMVSSQPQYTIPDEISDLKRAVRFIRYHAKEYGIDPDNIGITGSSAGGHLSLMIATSDDAPDLKSADPVEWVSARVQAAAVFYPPTDFINYGGINTSGKISQAGLVLTKVAAAFDFKEWNEKTGTYVSITDIDKRLEIARQVSPVTWVSADDPPIMLIHGDKDFLVPKQQSEILAEKLQAVNVTHKLLIKEGGSHGWRNREVEEANFITWFNTYLK